MQCGACNACAAKHNTRTLLKRSLKEQEKYVPFNRSLLNEMCKSMAANFKPIKLEAAIPFKLLLFSEILLQKEKKEAGAHHISMACSLASVSWGYAALANARQGIETVCFGSENDLLKARQKDRLISSNLYNNEPI